MTKIWGEVSQFFCGSVCLGGKCISVGGSSEWRSFNLPHFYICIYWDKIIILIVSGSACDITE